MQLRTSVYKHLFEPLLPVFGCIYLQVGFPHSSVGKEFSCRAGNPGSISESGRSPVEGNSNPLQYSCQENHMDRGPWQATVHGVARVGHDVVTKPPPYLQVKLLDNRLRIAKTPDFPVADFTFQCRGRRFNPWSRSSDRTCLSARQITHEATAVLQ